MGKCVCSIAALPSFLGQIVSLSIKLSSCDMSLGEVFFDRLVPDTARGKKEKVT